MSKVIILLITLMVILTAFYWYLAWFFASIFGMEIWQWVITLILLTCAMQVEFNKSEK